MNLMKRVFFYKYILDGGGFDLDAFASYRTERAFRRNIFKVVIAVYTGDLFDYVSLDGYILCSSP